MSAINENDDGTPSVVNVLFTMHNGMDTLDLTGPLEVFSHAKHNMNDASTKAFKCSFVAATEHVVTAQGASLRAHMDFEDAHEDLDEYDILVIPGGGVQPILDQTEEKPEHLSLIKAWAELQKKDPSKERTLFSVCTGSLLLAKAGVLQGFGATTHPDHYTKLEILCKEAARHGDLEQTDVMEERYVVNNARFDLGENIDENPYVVKKRPDNRRMSIARKGSNAWKESNKRRESNARRATLRLGGLRVITSGGISTGLDASLYLVAAMVSEDTAKEVARIMQYEWHKGVTVDGIDV
ncbi:class I glutamine amidotransferase-like protein [Patellaria atrata CBS 101060]|uniref:Class I glutamine amidotransferase-like protein n=1 Tax=Patellaria atrata CBS 101060 TaxID=1346257 RepID=A0A9P4S617_9PEZI|nr:class I glutamine amidotransferase-like protein [Patellaria atrata CBS 101060]